MVFRELERDLFLIVLHSLFASTHESFLVSFDFFKACFLLINQPFTFDFIRGRGVFKGMRSKFSYA